MENIPNHNNNLTRREEFGKPVIFVDTKPVKDAEVVISECESLISSINQIGGGQLSPVVPPSSGGFQLFQPHSKTTKNRAHSSQIIANYDKLQPKILDAEKVLRGQLLLIIDKKSVLRTQAKQIVTRLISCIDFQNSLLAKSDIPIQELRDVVNDLANESANVKTMVTFNMELLRLKTTQSVRQGKTVMSWARKRNANQGPSDEDLAKDPEHQELHHRLHQLRSLRELVVSNLTQHLEKKEVVSQTIDSYNSIRIQLQSFLKIDPLTPVSAAPATASGDSTSSFSNVQKRTSKTTKNVAVDSNGTFTTSDSDPGSPATASTDSLDRCVSPVPGKHPVRMCHGEIYDHSRCTDCSLSQTLAIDCIEHLSTLDAQTMETSRCLRLLVETREKMRDVVEWTDYDSASISHSLPPTNSFSSSSHSSLRSTGGVRKDGPDGTREMTGAHAHSSTHHHPAASEPSRSSILPSLSMVSSFGNFISSVYDDFSSQASGRSAALSQGPSPVGSVSGLGQLHLTSGARSLRSSRSSTGSFTDRSVETERSRGSARIGSNTNNGAMNASGALSSGVSGIGLNMSPETLSIGIGNSNDHGNHNQRLHNSNSSHGSRTHSGDRPNSAVVSTTDNSTSGVAKSPGSNVSLLTETNIKALQQIQIQTHQLADQRRSRPPSVASSASSASSSSIKSRGRSMSNASKESASSTASSASRKSGKCSTDGSSKDNRDRAVSAANSIASKVESKLISQQLAQQLETIHIRKQLTVDESMPERHPVSPTTPWSDTPISIIPRTRSLSSEGKDMAYAGSKLSPTHTPIRAGAVMGGSGYYHSPVGLSYPVGGLPRDSMSLYANNVPSPDNSKKRSVT